MKNLAKKKETAKKYDEVERKLKEEKETRHTEVEKRRAGKRRKLQMADFDEFARKLEGQFPEHKAGAWWRLGWQLRETGDEGNAQKCFVKSLTINPNRLNAAWQSLRPPIEGKEQTSRTLDTLLRDIGVPTSGTGMNP